MLGTERASVSKFPKKGKQTSVSRVSGDSKNAKNTESANRLRAKSADSPGRGCRPGTSIPSYTPADGGNARVGRYTSTPVVRELRYVIAGCTAAAANVRNIETFRNELNL